MDNKNLILAVAFSVAILFAFQFVSERLYPKPVPAPPTSTVSQPPAPPSVQSPGGSGAPTAPQQSIAPPGAGAGAGSTGPDLPAGIAAAETRVQALKASPRVHIDTPSLHGSIALTGGRIDDVTLINYRETIDPTSPEIVLFSPQGAPDAYFAEHGWVAPGGAIPVPGPTTAGLPTMIPDPGAAGNTNLGQWRGIIFKRTFDVDENYMFTMRQSVESKRGEAVSLMPYGLITRFGTPPTSGFFILYEGPLGVFNGTLEEVSYKDLQEKGVITHHTTGG